jgi:hypothetical protein
MNKHAALSLLFASVVGCTQSGPPVVCEGQMFFHDADGDGFGDPDSGTCEPQNGYVTKGTDCDDSAADIHPNAAEICDQVDNNCDGMIDDADPDVDSSGGKIFLRDADGDGYGDNLAPRVRACAAPVGYTELENDCDDTTASVHPGAAEVCDFIDNNCNGKIDLADPSIDLSTAASFFVDADGDGFGSGTAQQACTQPFGTASVGGDCNDSDNSSKPGGVEKCDGRDNNCDGGIDGTPAAPNQCAALVGTYGGTYQHLAQEKLGATVINTMACNGTGSGSLVLNRNNALQGTFTCLASTGGGGLFDQSQSVALRAEVGLTGAVTGTVEHTYRSSSIDPLKRTYNVTGTLNGSTLTLSGTGSFFPHPMSAVAWQVSYSFAANK